MRLRSCAPSAGLVLVAFSWSSRAEAAPDDRVPTGKVTIDCKPSCDAILDGKTALRGGDHQELALAVGDHDFTFVRGEERRTLVARVEASAPLTLSFEWWRPTPKYRSAGLRAAGIAITALGIASFPIGLALMFGGSSPSSCSVFCIPSTFAPGALVMGVGGTVVPVIGISLWVNGAKPPTADQAREGAWSLRPFVPRPFASYGARAPGVGAALVTSF